MSIKISNPLNTVNLINTNKCYSSWAENSGVKTVKLNCTFHFTDILMMVAWMGVFEVGRKGAMFDMVEAVGARK